MATMILFHCKICGYETYMVGDPTVQDLRAGLKSLRHEMKDVDIVRSSELCKIYSMEWSLKQYRKGTVKQSLVVNETPPTLALEGWAGPQP
jgi:hypothetical protein